MPNAKKPKTRSALNAGLNRYIFIILAILVLSTAFLMPSKPLYVSAGRVCFQGVKCLRFEYAGTPQKRELGLSGRSSLPGNTGMLFEFGEPSLQCMWMKDMRFNLDMIWLDNDHKIIKIAKNLTPETYPQSFCAQNTKYVLELTAGEADRLGLAIGDFAQL